jgi:regulator of sigma E protease
MGILIAILAVGVLIVVHEAGHYFVARWCKMRVERFSIGFGPALLKWKRHETDFTLGPIPFGGFVQIHGMLPSDDIDPNDERAYPNRPTWQRFVTIFAGPATNYLFAVVLILFLYSLAGVPTRYHVVDKLSPGFDAQGKLEVGDRILAINDEPVFQVRNGIPQEPMSAIINRIGEKPLQMTVLRAGKETIVTVTPKRATDVASDVPQYRLGIELGKHEEWTAEGAGVVLYSAVSYPVLQTKFILKNLYDIITRKQEGKMSGPVEITKMVKDSYDLGWKYLLQFMIALNIYLGLFNLLPLPALDGGRLAFLSYELATRRRPNPKIEATVHMVGVMALFVLLILVTYRDIADLF